MRTRKNLENLGKTRFFQSFLCSHTILTWFSHNSHTIRTRFSHTSHKSALSGTVWTCMGIVWEQGKIWKIWEKLGFFKVFVVLTRFSHNSHTTLVLVLTRFSHDSYTILTQLCGAWSCSHTILTQFSHTALTCFSHTWSKESGAEVCEGGCEKHVSANCNCNCSFSSHPHQHNHHDSDGFQFGCKNGELALTCAPKVFFMSQCNVISGWCT